MLDGNCGKRKGMAKRTNNSPTRERSMSRRAVGEERKKKS